MPNFQEYYLTDTSSTPNVRRSTMMHNLKSVLDTLVGDNGLFDHSICDSYGTGDYFIKLFDRNNNSIFEIHDNGDQAEATRDGWSKYKFIMNANNGATKEVTLSSTSNNTSNEKISGWRLGYGYTCQNGIIFNAIPSYVGIGANSSIPLMWCLITRNLNGDPFMVVSGYTGNVSTTGTSLAQRQAQAVSVMGVEHTVCTTDASPLLSIAKGSPAVRNQSVLVPLFSNSQVNEVSYSPYAARFYAGNMNAFLYDPQIHVITFNDTLYMTNGYWVLQL